MKGILLTALSVLALSGNMFAQRTLWENFPPEIRWDIGIDGGFSGITRPLGPEKAYQGTRTKVVPDYNVKLTYAITPNWNINCEVGSRTWESYGTWANPYYMGGALKNTEIKFQLGKPAITESFQLNYSIPFYSRFKIFQRATLYFGVTLGLVTTVSDGSTGYSRYSAPPDSSYRYISSYNYAAGVGYSFGAQVGYTYYIKRRWGVNVELAARYVEMGTGKTNGLSDDHMTNRYHMIFLPQTFGIRYRFK